MAKTRIIATIGPASRHINTLAALEKAGMSVARLNGSHNTLDWHAETIALLRKTLPDTPVLLDIPGRKIRTLQLKHEPSFTKGQTLILTTDTSHNGEEKVPVGYGRLHERLTVGDKVFADDGTLSFQVVNIIDRDIHLQADMDGQLKSRKGINVPGIDLGQALITEKDRDMIAFAKAHQVDYIGISFVESAAHINAIRALIGSDTPRIVAKVENSGGIEHLEEVIAAADVIMIDRGDLAVETSIDHVSLYQKQILRAASHAGKPTIVATELLHSMIENPLPTKAEVSDITNAVLDGAAAVMLSGETAVGRYPLEAVARIASVAQLAEQHLAHAPTHLPLHRPTIFDRLSAPLPAPCRSPGWWFFSHGLQRAHRRHGQHRHPNRRIRQRCGDGAQLEYAAGYHRPDIASDRSDTTGNRTFGTERPVRQWIDKSA